MDQRVDELKRDIERHRLQIAHLVDELELRLNPRNVAQRMGTRIRDRAYDVGAEVIRPRMNQDASWRAKVARYPLLATVAAALLGLLIARQVSRTRV